MTQNELEKKKKFLLVQAKAVTKWVLGSDKMNKPEERQDFLNQQSKAVDLLSDSLMGGSFDNQRRANASTGINYFDGEIENQAFAKIGSQIKVNPRVRVAVPKTSSP